VTEGGGIQSFSFDVIDAATAAGSSFGLSASSFAPYSADIDNDGVPNRLETDSDDGGMPDNAEAQFQQTYVPASGVDADGDGLDDAWDANLAGAENSVGLAPADTDADNLPDYLHNEDGAGDAIPAPTLNVSTLAPETLLTGTGIPGATVAFTDTNGALIALVDDNGEPLDPSEILVDSDGQYSVQPATSLSDGAEITATQSLTPHLAETDDAEAQSSVTQVMDVVVVIQLNIDSVSGNEDEQQTLNLSIDYINDTPTDAKATRRGQHPNRYCNSGYHTRPGRRRTGCRRDSPSHNRRSVRRCSPGIHSCRHF